MVYRVYVEKKREFAGEAKKLMDDARTFLGVAALERVRILNRYDVENIDRELFDYAVKTVFSEPQLDEVYSSMPETAGRVFAVEYLPGQYDQRADSAAQCIQIISRGERPAVRTARVYVLEGTLSDADAEAVKKYVINPVDSREASMEPVKTLAAEYSLPETVATVRGFDAMSETALADFTEKYGLAMDPGDLECCRDYFRAEGREPTITEIKVIDTYWSDHCRHTTFNTIIDSAEFADPELSAAWDEYLAARAEIGRTKPVTLMDLGTIGARYLKARGLLTKLDESEEINACTVKTKVTVDGEEQDWLLLFKNETHNHPTEIEPFGGAATCIGGAIRDPLSGRAYVYAAMRVTGAADPLRPVGETLEGKLPQRKLTTTAAAGYSAYGNQIGLATGQVSELYHPGYAAKRMEIGAVVGAVPAKNVRRETPVPGDAVILLGGRTGRDGCGGATGSSKAHTVSSLEDCGAEVQKGNPPEERKLQRLFRNPQAAGMIKRCNDFGAGGVSVAVGELADGLDVDLNTVPKKYEGLDGTELAISESQERMAVVVSADDAQRFCAIADGENLEATVIARVKAEPRLTMTWNGKKIVDISRAFLDTNGAEKHINVKAAAPLDWRKPVPEGFASGMRALAGDLNVCSRRGLSERFDSTIGAGTVLMPFGGKYQNTPLQAMVNKISCEHGETDDCSVMAWGFNPFIAEKSPFHAGYLAVAESASKLVAAGAEFSDVYLSFQEYFRRLGKKPENWGEPTAALLGAFRAQKALGAAAIGGKDSMSGSFEELHVPPTLVSFAVTTAKTGDIISGDFKKPGHRVVLIKPEYGPDGLPEGESLKAVFARVHGLIASGRAAAVCACGFGGAAECVMKMCFGNMLGFEFDGGVPLRDIFGYNYGSFVAELTEDAGCGTPLGWVTDSGAVAMGGESVPLAELFRAYEAKLEPVFPCNIPMPESEVPAFSYRAGPRPAPAVKTARPRVLIPVFPGTNCEYDSARAFEKAGAEPEIIVVRNLSSAAIAESVEHFAKRVGQAQMIFIPGGFSGGDEPDGSAKFITAFFRSGPVKDAVTELIDTRLGLMAGVCNGFQALIKLGLVPCGRIMDTDADCPTLTYNVIGRHQSMLVRTRIASNKSPWLAATEPGEIYTVPVSHGEGRFYAAPELVKKLAENGQIATQYVNTDGEPSMDVRANPNGSVFAVEGVTSPDGRIFGKMGHSERTGAGLYKNVPGAYDMGMFGAAVKYFK
jgi:phosphoribosylformylglycinamidine synthase